MNDNEALVAMKIYQQRHGGNLAEISILFANVVSALKEAAQQSVQPTVATEPLEDSPWQTGARRGAVIPSNRNSG